MTTTVCDGSLDACAFAPLALALAVLCANALHLLHRRADVKIGVDLETSERDSPWPPGIQCRPWRLGPPVALS